MKLLDWRYGRLCAKTKDNIIWYRQVIVIWRTARSRTPVRVSAVSIWLLKSIEPWIQADMFTVTRGICSQSQVSTGKYMTLYMHAYIYLSVIQWRHWGAVMGADPRVTPSSRWHPNTKLWLNLLRIVYKRGRTGKKLRGDTLREGGDTRVKWLKATVMTKNGRQFMRRK